MSLHDLAEQLEDQTCALTAFSRLCSCCHTEPVYLPNIAYLIEPIIEKQREIADTLHEMADKSRTSPSSPSMAKEGDVPDKKPRTIRVMSMKEGVTEVVVPEGFKQRDNETLAAFVERCQAHSER